MIRLFVALSIPEKIRNQIVEIRKRVIVDDSDYRWEDESKLHLTLKFIGEVKRDLLEKIATELQFLENYQTINCTLEKFGFFFRGKNDPRILWVGFKVDENIFMIVNQLNERLKNFSIPIESKKFKPHLTLLRIKTRVSEDFIDKFTSYKLPDISFTCSEISLMESELKKSGSIYKEIKKYKLH